MAANSEGNEFDVDEFLDSSTAVRVEELIAAAVHRGVIRAFWRILLIQLAVVAGMIVVGVFLSLLL